MYMKKRKSFYAFSTLLFIELPNIILSFEVKSMPKVSLTTEMS